MPDQTYTTLVVAYIAVALLVIIGWVLNIIELVGINDILTGEGILRVAGIFIPPLGAIMGYFV